MEENLSQQSKQALENLNNLKKVLNQVIPSDLTNYIITLVIKDQCHKKYLNYLDDN